MLLNISSITINENLCFGKCVSFLIWSLARCISASNNDSFPLQSGIFKYVLIRWNGVISIDLQNAIPNVCEKIIDNDNDLINVDLPPAFGPVIKIFFELFLPIRMSFVIGFVKYGWYNFLVLIIGFSFSTYVGKHIFSLPFINKHSEL